MRRFKILFGFLSALCVTACAGADNSWAQLNAQYVSEVICIDDISVELMVPEGGYYTTESKNISSRYLAKDGSKKILDVNYGGKGATIVVGIYSIAIIVSEYTEGASESTARSNLMDYIRAKHKYDGEIHFDQVNGRMWGRYQVTDDVKQHFFRNVTEILPSVFMNVHFIQINDKLFKVMKEEDAYKMRSRTIDSIIFGECKK